MAYDRNALRRELERDEGFRAQTYRCTAGKLSIGIGRNLDDVGIRYEETKKLGITKTSCIKNGITLQQAYGLLDSDIDECERNLDAKFPWWRKMTDVRQRVLLNMCFNMGITVLSQFKNTLKMMETGQYEAAAVNMGKSLWAKQVGRRAVRLQAMMRTG